MSSELNPDNLYQIRVRGVDTVSEQELDTIVIYKAEVTGSPAPTTRQGLAAFITQWRTMVLPNMSSQYIVRRYELREFTGRTAVTTPPAHNKLTYRDFLITAGEPSLDVGALSGDTCPPYVSVAIEGRSDLAGRASFGVHRMGPVLEPDQTAGSLNEDGLDHWDATAEFFLTAVVPAEFNSLTPVIFAQTEFLRNSGSPALIDYVQNVVNVTTAVNLGSQNTRKKATSRAGF